MKDLAQTKQIHADLIEQVRKGVRQAQMEIYKLYYKPMYNTSLRIVNRPDEAEDIMQESFLTAFTRISDYTGEGSFGGWLKRIVVNKSVDAVKKHRETLPIEDSESLQGSVDEPDTGGKEYLIEEIKKTMPLMREEDRVIVSLFLFEGYDHEEIAAILNISYNATRTRYSRAKSRLLHLLEKNRARGSFVHPN
ncbi:MAG: sigma-70 family RNA polymerase sigma factor [Bacteroidales bacterium]|nr:sigma-70 family RNA polymerase sigma factor [Bacteroidales bacterium]